MVLFGLLVLISLSTFALILSRQLIVANERRDHITSIYEHLHLDSSYRVQSADIIGPKIPYSWDSGRSFASSMTYTRNAGREETFADLDKRIKVAGFTKIAGPDYGEVAKQNHYVNSMGEYIRVSIETKAFHDAIAFRHGYPKPGSPAQIETGPVYVYIKVNIDDNNE